MDIYSMYMVFDDLLVHKVNKDIGFMNEFEIANSVNQDVDYIIKKFSIYDNSVTAISVQ